MQQLICCHFYGFPATNHSLTSLNYYVISDVISVPHMICWHTLVWYVTLPDNNYVCIIIAHDMNVYIAIHWPIESICWKKLVPNICSIHIHCRQSVNDGCMYDTCTACSVYRDNFLALLFLCCCHYFRTTHNARTNGSAVLNLSNADGFRTTAIYRQVQLFRHTWPILR